MDQPWDGLDADALVEEIVQGNGQFAFVRGQLKVRLLVPKSKTMMPDAGGAMRETVEGE